jgi:hypothetical protein
MNAAEREYAASRIEDGARYLPDYMVGAVKRYILHGIPPGSFLSAVICNDLREAFARADDENAENMRQWVQFFYNYAPSGCWGSPEKFSAWMAHAQQEIEA